MSNFDFLREALPQVHGDCARAESYLSSDPRSACFYSRRAIEVLATHLYEVLALPSPYRTDLSARINDAAFKTVTGNGINQKLNLIRRVANAAVHDAKPIRTEISLSVVRELFHVAVWAAFHHSARPDAVPTGARFDPALAAKAAPLSRDQLVKLAARIRAQDAAHERALAARDDRIAEHEAEIATLREQITAAQATITRTDDHDYSEADTRDLFIDVLLAEAGWPLAARRSAGAAATAEYPVSGMPNAVGAGFVDYVLWGADGVPLAVVEAKKTRMSAQVGQHQAKLYADCLEAEFGRRPVIFYSNGYEHWLWDDAGGYPPRQVQGFYTHEELELAVQRRQARKPLADVAVDRDIAGRYYQERAIRAVGDAFTSRQREALLVMATGSGKTRTAIALVDQLMRANWVKRVLFLADRTALVGQAANAFKTHLPAATTVNLVSEKGKDGRVYVSTYPTMLNLVNDLDADAARPFGPGYFDLIVIDEAHRSVYAKYGAIFEWFDGLLLGLTATPKDEVDHNTYRLFHLEDGVPTDAYSLDEAVADGYLVPPEAVSLGTKFLNHGIKYVDLSEDEQDQWDQIDWGGDVVPEEIGAEALNRFLFNEDTVDKVLATLMSDGLKVAGGERLGKTIVFAKNQAHAEFIQRRFDLGWPGYGGRFARVITHSVAYAQNLIDDFSMADKSPHIAISVDMLDTGIDVPDVVNLVFFKLVRSKTKFWQMIGRGTRLRPDLFGPGEDKTKFFVFDFCGNLEYFSQDLPGTPGSTQRSLSQRIFEARLGILTALAGGESEFRTATADALRDYVAGMNVDNILVRPHRQLVARYTARSAWDALTDEATGVVNERLAGLPSSTTDTDIDAKRFDLLVMHQQLAQLHDDNAVAERLRATIQGVAVALLGKTSIPAVEAQAELLEAVAGDDWWVDVTVPLVESMRRSLRSLVRFVDKSTRNPVYTDFEDELSGATVVDLPGVTPGMDFDRFREKTAAYLRQHEDHVALQRLRRNKQLTPSDLSALEQMLADSGAQSNTLARASEQSGGLGLFIRSLVGLERWAAVDAFSDYLDGEKFSLHQIRFVEMIVDELTAHGVVEPRRLYEVPYIDRAPTGPDHVFPETDVDGIVAILRQIKRHATLAAA
ncbi:MAG: DEAD/DEAH box helicase family protein [Patulibacter sp.]|nr:DEAD/DEAH box helicase family protein [Patulibacter sp.]